MDLGALFNVIAVLYGIKAVQLLVQLKRAGKVTFDDTFTPEDRRLVGGASFFLLVPFAVALHELGHALATWAFGGRIVEFHFMFYWGYVVPQRAPDFLPWQEALIAFAGNAVSLAMGFGAALWTVLRPKNAAWNFLRLEVARILLGLTLVMYPLMSLITGFGDFAILRESLNRAMPLAGDIVIGLYGLGAAWAWWMWRRGGPWRERYLLLATPLFDSRRLLDARLAADPSDVDALRELSRVEVALGDMAGAQATLTRAVAIAPNDPRTQFLAGVTALKAKNAQKASEHLRAAGSALDEAGGHADLRHETTLALAAARLQLGDAEGAILTAEAALEARPGDLRSVLMHADALVAAGQREEAQRKLEAALTHAEGVFAHEIRRRIEALPRAR